MKIVMMPKHYDLYALWSLPLGGIRLDGHPMRNGKLLKHLKVFDTRCISQSDVTKSGIHIRYAPEKYERKILIEFSYYSQDASYLFLVVCSQCKFEYATG